MNTSRPRPIPLLALAVTMLTAGAVRADLSDYASLYFFFQRTIYLENLYQEGSWWANPARIAPIDAPSLYTGNIGLLGGKHSLSTIRVIVPVKKQLTAGFGVTGASAAEGRYFSGDGGGAKFGSRFSFSVPSFEAALCYDSPFAGTIGGLLIGGTESLHPAGSSINKTYFFWGFDAGYLSPPIWKTVRLSLASLSVYHALGKFWDHSAKAGVLLDVEEGLVMGSLEYGFSLREGPVFLRVGEEDLAIYETLKGIVSIRIRSIAGVLLGYSMDTPNFRDNGSTYHAGIELRRSKVYPFFGGYELGMSTFASRHSSTRSVITLLHRIWVGYEFRGEKES